MNKLVCDPQPHPSQMTPSKFECLKMSDESGSPRSTFIPSTPAIILQPENIDSFFGDENTNDSDKSKSGLAIVETVRPKKAKKRKR